MNTDLRGLAYHNLSECLLLPLQPLRNVMVKAVKLQI